MVPFTQCPRPPPPDTGHLFLSRKIWFSCPERPSTLLFPSGKHKSRRPLLISSHVGGKPIFLRDPISGHQFLVDTGAARSMLPHSSSTRADGPRLVGTDERPLMENCLEKTSIGFPKVFISFPSRSCTKSHPWNQFPR